MECFPFCEHSNKEPATEVLEYYCSYGRNQLWPLIIIYLELDHPYPQLHDVHPKQYKCDYKYHIMYIYINDWSRNKLCRCYKPGEGLHNNYRHISQVVLHMRFILDPLGIIQCPKMHALSLYFSSLFRCYLLLQFLLILKFQTCLCTFSSQLYSFTAIHTCNCDILFLFCTGMIYNSMTVTK